MPVVTLELEPGTELPVLEIFVHGHWAPWAVFFKYTEELVAKAITDAELRLKPLRYRESTTACWGGPQKTLERMNKCFGHNNN